MHKTTQATIIFHRKTSLKKTLRIILASLLFVSIWFICYSNYSVYLTGSSYLSNLYKSMYIEYNHSNQSSFNNSNNTSSINVNVSFISNLTEKSSINSKMVFSIILRFILLLAVINSITTSTNDDLLTNG